MSQIRQPRIITNKKPSLMNLPKKIPSPLRQNSPSLSLIKLKSKQPVPKN